MKTIKRQFDTIDFFIIISQDQGFTYSISAKALTHPVPSLCAAADEKPNTAAPKHLEARAWTWTWLLSSPKAVSKAA